MLVIRMLATVRARALLAISPSFVHVQVLLVLFSSQT